MLISILTMNMKLKQITLVMHSRYQRNGSDFYTSMPAPIVGIPAPLRGSAQVAMTDHGVMTPIPLYLSLSVDENNMCTLNRISKDVWHRWPASTRQ